jgi:acetylornithine deacetylase
MSTVTTDEQRILDEIDRGFDAQIAFLQGLVRCPSVRGAEHTVQDYVFDALAKRGYAMDRWRVSEDDIKDHPGFSPIAVSCENAWVVVGTHRPSTTTGRSLIMNAHIDIVPPGPTDMWSTPPYDPVIRDGWMYGRGAADMKAGLACNIYALDAIRRAGFEPAATIHVQSVPEEESTGNGTLATSVRGYRADAAICPEPTNGSITHANVGVVWFSVRVYGRPAHAREMQAGINAIDAAYQVVGALRVLEEQLNVEAAQHPLFKDLTHPINLNIGQIEGGDWNSTVPASCTVQCRLSMLPGTPASELKRRIEQTISDFSRKLPGSGNTPPVIQWTGFSCEGFVLEEGSDAEKTLATAHEAIFGATLKRQVMPAYLDARVTILYDKIPTLVYGPGGRNIHSIDEALDVESMRRATKSIALFTARWCGLAALKGA